MGPYSGYFIESGSATSTDGYTFTSFTANFTIYAPNGDVLVTGQKTLDTSLLFANTGHCPTFSNGSFPVTDAPDDYVAMISTAYQDTGNGQTFVTGNACTPKCATATFSETFNSTSLLPLDTTGKATGGGQILDAATQQYVTFGFEVHSTQVPNQYQGRCAVIDQTTNTQVKCLNVADYTQIGTTASWDGTADVNGTTETSHIVVQDNGQPPNQVVPDTFSITTPIYSASGPVVHGNVQVHQQS
jgi:hypothetical protein